MTEPPKRLKLAGAEYPELGETVWTTCPTWDRTDGQTHEYVRADLVPAWRPIETAETAPMNPGDSIIVWDGMQAREAVLLIGQNARGTVRAWVTTDGERICGITKWMPFPAGPTPPEA